MNGDEIRAKLDAAVSRLNESDIHLLENNVSERCIAARLAHYLQVLCPSHHVDVEYNRAGAKPKRLGLPPECANYEDPEEGSLVVPDLIIHKRGAAGPNLLVVELKKTTDPRGPGCDRKRVPAFMSEFGYTTGAVIVCETRKGRAAKAEITDWAQ
jgi:hypothetical protein